MTSLIFITLLLTGAVGVTLAFIGWLFAFLTAFGNKQYAFGIASLFPPFALIYCAKHWQTAKHAGKMLFTGSALLALCGLVYFIGNQIPPA